MLADRFIEGKEHSTILLENLLTLNQTADTWISGTGYGFCGLSYKIPLQLNHHYYQRFTYKFTTTNQSPTWCQMYLQGGGNGGATINNPVANTEYTVSMINQPNIKCSAYPNWSGTMYHGNSNAINGVTGYIKNVMLYDVTDLYYYLLSERVITNLNELKTWCDNNLTYHPKNEVFRVDVNDLDYDRRIAMKDGSVMATNEFVETDGMQYYSVSNELRNNTWFDTGSGVSVYNNSGGGTVTHTRIDASTVDSPFYPEHKYVLQITTNGTASPGAGGFIATHMAYSCAIFIEKFVAKVPVGYTVECAYNSQGSGSSVEFLSSKAGTGNWEEYTILYCCGSSDPYSSGGHVYISGSSNTSVTWYLAYVNNCDISLVAQNTLFDAYFLKAYTVLPKKTQYYRGTVFNKTFDERNLIPNGDCSNLTTSMLPSGWSYDTEDIPTEAYNGIIPKAHASIVQPVGASSGFYGGNVKINPTSRYKISFWVKCKADMSSFLTAIYLKTASGTVLTHNNVVWVSGTKTSLASALNDGDTTVTLNSAANWVKRNYSELGFRSGGTWATNTYNDIATVANGSGGIVSSVSGNVVTLSKAYSGNTIPAGTAVVESYDGGNYPYPIQKSSLPTDNTWKYVEGYFGADGVIWEGNGSGWVGIPGDARQMQLQLNLYANNGTVPIKYADIRVEDVGAYNGHRYENKIQLKKEDF